MNPTTVAQLVKTKIIIDTRNSLNRKDWESAGFKYVLLGDGKTSPAYMLK